VFKAFDSDWGAGQNLRDAWHHRDVPNGVNFVATLSSDVLLNMSEIPTVMGIRIKQTNDAGDQLLSVVVTYTDDLSAGFEGPIIFSECGSTELYLDFDGPLTKQFWHIVFITPTPNSLKIFEVEFDTDCKEPEVCIPFPCYRC
jgi:hypothetical protein